MITFFQTSFKIILESSSSFFIWGLYKSQNPHTGERKKVCHQSLRYKSVESILNKYKLGNTLPIMRNLYRIRCFDKNEGITKQIGMFGTNSVQLASSTLFVEALPAVEMMEKV